MCVAICHVLDLGVIKVSGEAAFMIRLRIGIAKTVRSIMKITNVNWLAVLVLMVLVVLFLNRGPIAPVQGATANVVNYTLPSGVGEVISISNTRAGLGVAYRGKDGEYYMIQYSGENGQTEYLFKFTRSK